MQNNQQPICPVCGIKLTKKKWKNRNRYVFPKFCSLKCKGKEDYKKRFHYYKNYWLTRPHLWKWKKNRICLDCKKEFIPNTSKQSGCSPKCCGRIGRRKWKRANRDKVNKWQNEWFKKKARENWYKRICKNCNKEFLPDLKHKNQQVYCSTNCRQKWNRKWINKTEHAKAKKRFEVSERKHRLRANGGKFTYEEWKQMKKDCGYTCQICGKKEPEIKLVRDHIVPIVKEGKHCKENIQPLCISCNCRKHDN